MRKLHSLVADSVAACLARKDGVLAVDVLEHLLTTESQEIALHFDAAMRKGLLSLIREALKETSLDDGVATGEPAQLSLPGYKAPTTLPIRQTNGEYRYVRFEKLTGKEFLQAIETRKNGIAHDYKRLQDLEQKWDILRPFLTQNETMTVADAVQLITQENFPVA